MVETLFRADTTGKGAATVLKMEGLSADVTPTVLGEAAPERSSHGDAVELKWNGAPEASGGASFSFPAAQDISPSFCYNTRYERET